MPGPGGMLMKKVAAKSSSSTRVAWGPIVIKFPKNLQLLLVYKNWLGKFSFQVMSGGRANHKVPLGQVAKCEPTSYQPNGDGEISQYLNFENKEGLKVQYNVNILDVFTAGDSALTRELANVWTPSPRIVL